MEFYPNLLYLMIKSILLINLSQPLKNYSKQRPPESKKKSQALNSAIVTIITYTTTLQIHV